MSAGAWSQLLVWAEEVWDRHVRYRELYRQLDRMRAEVKARTAWLDDLTEEDMAEMLRGLTKCIDAMQAAGSDVPDRPDGALSSRPGPSSGASPRRALHGCRACHAVRETGPARMISCTGRDHP
ncbi:hypothetical protein AB0C96_24555 [Streptomyces sp. NPDC048506]|uniref:hypothetical protein n=1 Tax=Streptomyces sp. NPDC048506 TaxID=3155028 RepID=UPI00343887F7